MKRALIILIGLFVITLATMAYLKADASPSLPMIKSVRVDLSSMDVVKDKKQFVKGVLDNIQGAGGNTVFLSPWADGEANYRSKIAPIGLWGNGSTVEEFLAQAHARQMKVFAWFVVGKDDFPADLHPEWYAKTPAGKNYDQEDEPGIFLPIAALYNSGYANYHQRLMGEIARMAFDGYVISEPVIGWDPVKLPQGVDKAKTVTNFVKGTMLELRKSLKPIVITVYNEPEKNGTLKSNTEIKNWLGLDLDALIALKPDYIEVQDLFSDFEFKQPPEWTSSFIKQYRERIPASIPLLVSIQGYAGDHNMTEKAFATAMKTAIQSKPAGVSFYAYHLAPKERWANLKKLWP